MLKIENPQQTSEGRMPPRSWYIPTGAGKMTTLNGVWKFAFFPLGDIREDIAFEEESHYNSLLEYPQYTRPYEWHGKKVPDVLLSGHHANICKWRREQQLKRTYERRPDLLESAELDKKDKQFLETLKNCE